MSKEGNRNSITGKKLRNQSTALLINRSGTVRPDQRGLQSPHLSIFQHQHALPLSHTRITCSPLITHPHQRALPLPHTCISVLSPYHTPASHALPLPHTCVSVLFPYHTPASACSPLITHPHQRALPLSHSSLFLCPPSHVRENPIQIQSVVCRS